MKSTVKAALAVVIIAALCSITYSTRALFPSPGYAMRLNWLLGWPSRGYYGVNCSGYITNAHGSAFMESNEMYAGGNGQLRILVALPGREALVEVQGELRPGDIAAFRGIRRYYFASGTPDGVHVAAYLGNDMWADGDSRRGYVAQYRLEDVSATDPWFQGRVQVLRWLR